MLMTIQHMYHLIHNIRNSHANSYPAQSRDSTQNSKPSVFKSPYLEIAILTSLLPVTTWIENIGF